MSFEKDIYYDKMNEKDEVLDDDMNLLDADDSELDNIEEEKNDFENEKSQIADDSVKIYLQQIGRIPLLSSEEELEVAKEIKEKKLAGSKRKIGECQFASCCEYCKKIYRKRFIFLGLNTRGKSRTYACCRKV